MTRFNQVVVDKTASFIEVGAGLGNPHDRLHIQRPAVIPRVLDRLRTSCLPASTCVRPPRPPLTSIDRFALVPTPPSSWAHRVLHQAALQLCRARTANDRITFCPDLVTLLSSHQVRAYKAARDKLARPPCRTRATPGPGIQGYQGQARKATVSHMPVTHVLR